MLRPTIIRLLYATVCFSAINKKDYTIIWGTDQLPKTLITLHTESLAEQPYHHVVEKESSLKGMIDCCLLATSESNGNDEHYHRAAASHGFQLLLLRPLFPLLLQLRSKNLPHSSCQTPSSRRCFDQQHYYYCCCR